MKLFPVFSLPRKCRNDMWPCFNEQVDEVLVSFSFLKIGKKEKKKTNLQNIYVSLFPDMQHRFACRLVTSYNI